MSPLIDTDFGSNDYGAHSRAVPTIKHKSLVTEAVHGATTVCGGDNSKHCEVKYAMYYLAQVCMQRLLLDRKLCKLRLRTGSDVYRTREGSRHKVRGVAAAI